MTDAALTPALMNAPSAAPSGEARRKASTGFGVLIILSFLVNLLFLTGPVFMMQVYDRVLPSGNIATLIGLFAIAVLLYAAFGVFDAIRLQIAAIRGEQIAQRYAGPAFETALAAAAVGDTSARANAPEDVEAIRSYLTSPSLIALFDLPAIPFFFLAVTLLHPILGLTVIVAGIILAGLAVWNERLSRAQMNEGAPDVARANQMLVDARSDAISLLGNGMSGAAKTFWTVPEINGRLGLLDGTRLLAMFSSLTKTLRLAIQSLVLGIGGWLAVQGVLSPGAMIAASIVFARAIAPIEQTLNSYRQLLRARSAWANIKSWSDEDAAKSAPSFTLPAPSQSMRATKLSIAAPESDKLLVRDVSFALEAGDIMGIIGPSGAGKSTLSRALVGAWPVQGGRLMIDGADLTQWPASARGNFIGYLAQSVHLMDATISENIAHLDPTAPPKHVIAAGKAAGVHELILSFPDGYATQVGTGGGRLSGGQRQRIGLARALFNDPFILVLDEPAAHLDPDGLTALASAIAKRKRDGKITIFASHAPQLMRLSTKLMSLEHGRMTVSGPRDEVLAHMKVQRVEAGEMA